MLTFEASFVFSFLEVSAFKLKPLQSCPRSYIFDFSISRFPLIANEASTNPIGVLNVIRLFCAFNFLNFLRLLFSLFLHCKSDTFDGIFVVLFDGFHSKKCNYDQSSPLYFCILLCFFLNLKVAGETVFMSLSFPVRSRNRSEHLSNFSYPYD